MDIRGLMPTAQSAWAFLKSVLWKTMTIKRLCDHNWFSSILSICKWFTTFCHIIIFSHHLLYQLPEGKVGREEAQWVWVEMWTMRHNCSHQFLTSHGMKMFAPREWGMKTQICTSVSGSFPSATAISCVGCVDTSPPVVERVPERGLQGFSSCSTFDLYHAVPRLLPQSVQPEVWL